MRGQAFVIFKDINSAMEVKRRFNGKELYNKTMVFMKTSRGSSSQKKSQISLPNLMVPFRYAKNLKITIKSNTKISSSSDPSRSKPKLTERRTTSRRHKMYYLS